MRKKKVLLGMSGGVDSSMTAWYLLQQGFEVIGVTFNIVSPLSSDTSKDFIVEAKTLAEKLHFHHYVFDAYEEFQRSVVKYFTDEYLAGRTPSPCIHCNNTIKWKFLYEEAERLGCDYISTGHYVRLIKRNEDYHIQKGIDPLKDQSYFLWNLPQYILKKCIFPLGSKMKKDVKQKALELGFRNISHKKESMGVCFLQGQNYRDFLLATNMKSHKNMTKGIVKNSSGETIGTHEGVALYTIGQKRGLQLSKNQGEYVATLDGKNNIITTAMKEELHSSSLKINDYSFANPNYLNSPKEVDIRIRGYDCVPPTPGTIKLLDQQLVVHFSNPVWAITPGQSIVFYEYSDIVVGGGIVDEVIYDRKG